MTDLFIIQVGAESAAFRRAVFCSAEARFVQTTEHPFIKKMERKADINRDTIEKYGHWGLLLFVAIPLPGTGAWTASLIAALLNIRTAKAVPVILIGVCIAAAIITLVTYGVIHIVT